jgi:hypothetical protein
MKPFLPALLLCSWLALSAWSQPIALPQQQALFALRQFLGLTDSQISAIVQNNDDYNTFSLQQQQNIQQARIQIAKETAKDQIDPMALGSLYAAIETSCRGLRVNAAAAQQQNIAVLTDDQKAKLSALNSVMNLGPVITVSQAQSAIEAANGPQYAFRPSFSGINTFMTVSGEIAGCIQDPVQGLPAVGPEGSQSSVAGVNGLEAQKAGLVNPFYGEIPKVANRP